MESKQPYDVIIIGGSNAGLSAAMSLGRASKRVLVIDSGAPCNLQTPHSHNFLTNDGKTPKEIRERALAEVLKYPTVEITNGLVTDSSGGNNNFKTYTANNEVFFSKKLLFASGVKDIMPNIPGFTECWGISVIHCPYCHGYEYRDQNTGIITNGELALDFGLLSNNWTEHLTIFTNGECTISENDRKILTGRKINIIEDQIDRLVHSNGQVRHIEFADGRIFELEALYARPPFEQHSKIPEKMGCVINEQGYVEVDEFKRTTVPGIYAAGDNTNRMRSVANAVGAGSAAGAFINHDMIKEAV